MPSNNITPIHPDLMGERIQITGVPFTLSRDHKKALADIAGAENSNIRAVGRELATDLLPQLDQLVAEWLARRQKAS